MRGHGIAGALWSAVRRLTFALGGIRAAAFTTIAVFTLAISGVRADVIYDYTGNHYVSNTGPFTTSDRITGDVVFANPLPPSSTIPATDIVSYSFTDGVVSISNTNATGNAFSTPGDEFFTDSSGNIVLGQLTVFGGGVPSVSVGGIPSNRSILSITPVGDASTVENSCCFVTAQSAGAGTWSAAPPSLYLTVSTNISGIPASDQQSLSLKPVDISASLALSTTKPENSFEVPLPKQLSPQDTTLQAAAADLGYIGFDWDQTLVWPTPTPLYACKDPSCEEVEQVGSTKMSDPGTQYGFGLDYCNKQSPHYDGVDADCAHEYYYDPSIAKSQSSSDSFCTQYFMGNCLHNLTEDNDTVLNFFDSPRDPCLVNQSASPDYNGFQLALYGQSYAYQNSSIENRFGQTAKDVCGGMTTTGPGEEVFQTDLIGLKEDGPPAILATFDWTNTFNGWLTAEGTGGIVLAVAGATDVASDSTSGTGGITIVDIDGQAVSEVPEPPSGLLLSSVTILFILVGRVHAKNQTARSRVAGWRDTRCRAGACAKLQ